jgi:chorismate synthase
MKSCFGENLRLSLFGESHGEAVGVVIDGLGAGIKLDLDFIRNQLDKRSPKGKISTQRKEKDDFALVSGFFEGYTTGTPLCILIPNSSQKSRDYSAMHYLLRPSHADYTAFVKYKGYQDYRGGGHFSGRITAALVAAGAICLQVLRERGIVVATHILSCNGQYDIPFSKDENELKEQQAFLNDQYFPVLSSDAASRIRSEMEHAAEEGDSVGGILETVVTGLPAGIGEPFFGSVESVLSSLLFSIPAIKGVEFGLGFGFASGYGSERNDPFLWDEGVKTKTNNNGGINGGITNGMPLLARCVVKPTPSIYKEQDTVDYRAEENARLQIRGRHDPAIIHRARVVVDSMMAIGLLDLLCEQWGTAPMGAQERKEKSE